MWGAVFPRTAFLFLNISRMLMEWPGHKIGASSSNIPCRLGLGSHCPLPSTPTCFFHAARVLPGFPGSASWRVPLIGLSQSRWSHPLEAVGLSMACDLVIAAGI